MSFDYDDAATCKCGHKPEIYTQFPVAKQMYQGVIECPVCGEYARGVQWHWDADSAIEDAIEEWNKKVIGNTAQ